MYIQKFILYNKHKRKEKYQMIIRENGVTYSDHLDEETLIPGGKLRSLSQSQWIEKTLKHDKIGLIVNNELQLALMHWSKYKEMFDAMKSLKERNIALEEMLEDLEAVQDYSERAEKYEDGESTLISASSPEE